MQDLISRQAAIKKLMECGDFYEGNDEAKRGVSQCMGIIYDIPPAKQWIPVSERLPEPGQWVIATYERTYSDTGRTRRLVVDTIYSARTGWNDTPDIKTVAWMPMPEPYTTQSNDPKALDALGKGEE